MAFEAIWICSRIYYRGTYHREKVITMVKQTAGREMLGEFAPKFAQLNDDVLRLPPAVKPEMGEPSALLILSPDVVNNPADKQQIH